MIMDRVFPVETKHNIEVVHKTVDLGHGGGRGIARIRKLGTDARQADRSCSAATGLARIEALEAADANRRAQAAKVIDADEVIEAEIMPAASPAATSDEPAYALDPEEDDI